MRRVLVILLIFLLPLQLYADSLNCQIATHQSVAADPVFYGADNASGFDLAANPDDPEELPAGVDFHDSLGSAALSLQLLPLDFPHPGYTLPSSHLLFLPVIKPPPVA